MVNIFGDQLLKLTNKSLNFKKKTMLIFLLQFKLFFKNAVSIKILADVTVIIIFTDFSDLPIVVIQTNKQSLKFIKISLILERLSNLPTKKKKNQCENVSIYLYVYF